jgi:hypothetical protein
MIDDRPPALRGLDTLNVDPAPVSDILAAAHLRKRRRQVVAGTVTATLTAAVIAGGYALAATTSSAGGTQSGGPVASTPGTTHLVLDVDFTAAHRPPGQRLIATYLGPSRAVWDPATETAYLITRPWFSTSCPPSTKATLTDDGTLELDLARDTAATPGHDCVFDNRHLIAIVHGVNRAPRDARIATDSDGGAATSGTRGPDRIVFTGLVADNWKPAPTPHPIATSNFPRNSHGQTYGSSGRVLDYEDTPDLIASVADSGVVGFVLRTDMEGDSLEGPIPVYDFEGEVVVGMFPLAEASEIVAICDGQPCAERTPGQPRMKKTDQN